MQLIYDGKTEASYPKVKFPSSCSLSANPKHFSNTAESLKLINEVIVPYVDEQRKTLGDANQAALLIIDVFRESNDRSSCRSAQRKENNIGENSS